MDLILSSSRRSKLIERVVRCLMAAFCCISVGWQCRDASFLDFFYIIIFRINFVNI